MTELFESTIDNVSELEFSGHSDLEMRDRVIEVWAKSGDEEYIYKFKGPGVELNILSKIDTENEKLKEKNGELAEENEKLKEEGYILRKDLSERATEIKKLKKENEHIKENLQSQHKMVVELNQKNHELQDENSELKYLLEGIQRTKDLVEEKLNTREGILEQAKECVCGQREQDYGTPESNFQLIADLWNGYLGFMDHPQDQIRATDVAMMMALMKIARIRNGGGSGDSFVDLAGYAACGGEIYYGERHSST